MDLTAAYNKLQKKEDTKPQLSTLAIRTNPDIVSVFNQAVNLIAPNRWITSPREIRKQDYYFYLRFNSEYDFASLQAARQKRPIFAVEKIVSPNDVFQYRNKNGEMDLYVRPLSSLQIKGLDLSDCFDDKSAFVKFTKAIPDESFVMKNLSGSQEHVIYSFSFNYNIDRTKTFSIALFKDGNAYMFKGTFNTPSSDPHETLKDFNSSVTKLDGDSFVNYMARSIKDFNKYNYFEAGINAPVKRKISCSQLGLYVDYLMHNGKPYPDIYKTPENDRQSYIRQQKCSFCGCTFLTSSAKKCLVCGKKKDY